MTTRSLHIILALVAAIMLLPALTHGQVIDSANGLDQLVDSVVKSEIDSTSTALIPSADTSRFIRQKVDLDHVVEFTAKDSIILIGRNHAMMYGGSKIVYGDIDVTASSISMDMDSSQVHAIGVPDSVGELTGNPVFKDNSGEYESRVMKYNFKTKRGYITDIVTEQGEGYLTGGITKKTEDDEYYIKNGRYTTCDDHEHPHFYFQLTKAKVKPKKNVVTGPAYMVLEDLPLPIAVPFGYFPFSEKYQSGILVPTFGEDYNRGFYLRNGGYYLALGQYADLALTGEIYTRGSWGLTAQSSYVKRYKYSGSLSASYLTTITGQKGDPDYNKMHNFQVLWSHSQNQKANPYLTFSASVNFATTGYSRNSLNTYYTSAFTENTKSSTVNLTYKIPNSKWTFSTTANVSQRTADSTITVSFPNLTINMSQTAPFKRKRAVGDEKWYEKIKVSYTGRFQNSLTAKQNEFIHKNLVKDWRNGMSHTIPVQATFNVMKYFNITPTITMNDRMYTSKIRQQWDPNASAVVRDTSYSFYNIFDFSFGVSLSTKVYGFFKPLKFLGKISEKLQMVRHVMTPSISFSAAPDFSAPFWGYYGNLDYVDNSGNQRHSRYSYFQHGLYGNAPSGKSGTISFNIANNLEAKVKSESDSTGFKKISLIENFTLSQSCNLAADSMKWSNLNTSIMLRLFKGFNLNLSATWDVYKYALNESGAPVRINKLRLFNGGGWGRLSSTGTSFSYTFNNDTFKRKRDKEKDKKNDNQQPQGRINRGEENDENAEGQDNSGPVTDLELIDGYAKWECPWSLTVNYSLSYGYGSFNYDKLEYNGRWTQNLSLNASIRPTKNWSISASASYNFDTHKIAYMNCSISRQMHCFEMSASFVPVGPYKSYNFHIAVKSSILQDVKYDKHSSINNGVTWY
ncbi:MAG: putative LPS assembly protein LptD [Bacteroidales bacterium]|nr:putative LPS assembly protein LptD [Bacteroidales bacterium]